MLSRIHSLCCAAVICTAAWALADQPDATTPVVGIRRQPPSSYALTGATIVPQPGEVLKNATLVMEGGRITEIGLSATVPKAAETIDMTGKTIHAGFIDAYGESDLPDPKAGASYWNEHVTPHLRIVDHYAADEKKNASLRQQGIVARLVAPSNGLVKGISALVTTGDGSVSESILQDAVGLHIRLSPRRSSGRTTRYPGSPMGAVALVRQVFHDAQWYRRAHEWADRHPLDTRPETNIALESISNSKLPLIVDGQNERYFLRGDRMGREFNRPVIMRGSGREYRRLREIAATGRAVLLPVSFPKAPDVSTPEAAASASLERLLHWNLAPDNPWQLEQAGVTFAFTTDGLQDTKKFLTNIRTAVKRGLPERAAPSALTTSPAKLLGSEGELGTLESGKLASLVVTDGPLFEKKTKIVETWVAGQRFQHNRFDLSDVRGTWSVTLRSADNSQVAGDVKLSGSRSKLKGQLLVADKKYELKNILWQNHRLSFAFEGELLASAGRAQVTFVVTSRDLSRDFTLGTGTWPDGSRLSARMRLVQPRHADDEDDAVEEDKEQEKTVGDDGQTSDPTQQTESPRMPKESDGPTIAIPADEESAAEGGDKESKEQNDASDHALYPVHYPLGAYGRESVPARPEWVAFTSATLWTCGEAGKLSRGTVLVHNGRIEQVGDDIDIPEDAVTVDCQGKHITPGIIDCHSHIATDGGVNESTQAITAEVRIGDFIDGDDISIYRQLAGGVTSANILHGSANPIGGQNQVIKMRWGAEPEALKFENAPAGIKFALGENVKQSNWNSPRTRYPQTRMGVDEIMSDAFRRAQEYTLQRKEAAEGRRAPLRVDLELEALAEVLAGTRWIHCHSYRQSEIVALLNTCKRFDVTIGTLQHILEGYKVADEMREHGVMGSSFADWWAYKFEVYDAIPYSGALMHNAGVVVSFNSDDAEMGRRLNLEAAKAVKFGGVPPTEALKFVTSNPARQLRIDEWVGTLEAGKHADLVVWSDQPLSVYAICEQTWVDGRKYFDLAEHRELRDRDQARHAALVQQVLKSGAPQLKPGERDRTALEAWPRYDEFCRCRNLSQNE